MAGNGFPRSCTCDPCLSLLAECGEEHFALYRKKLLRRGWAGKLSPVERAYVNAHRRPSSEKQRAAILKMRAAMPRRGKGQAPNAEAV